MHYLPLLGLSHHISILLSCFSAAPSSFCVFPVRCVDEGQSYSACEGMLCQGVSLIEGLNGLVIKVKITCIWAL